jgi:hypothetical protein
MSEKRSCGNCKYFSLAGDCKTLGWCRREVPLDADFRTAYAERYAYAVKNCGPRDLAMRCPCYWPNGQKIHPDTARLDKLASVLSQCDHGLILWDLADGIAVQVKAIDNSDREGPELVCFKPDLRAAIDALPVDVATLALDAFEGVQSR